MTRTACGIYPRCTSRTRFLLLLSRTAKQQGRVAVGCAQGTHGKPPQAAAMAGPRGLGFVAQAPPSVNQAPRDSFALWQRGYVCLGMRRR